jgi:hypothetical protein
MNASLLLWLLEYGNMCTECRVKTPESESQNPHKKVFLSTPASELFEICRISCCPECQKSLE